MTVLQTTAPRRIVPDPAARAAWASSPVLTIIRLAGLLAAAAWAVLGALPMLVELAARAHP